MNLLSKIIETVTVETAETICPFVGKENTIKFVKSSGRFVGKVESLLTK